MRDGKLAAGLAPQHRLSPAHRGRVVARGALSRRRARCDFPGATRFPRLREPATSRTSRRGRSWRWSSRATTTAIPATAPVGTLPPERPRLLRPRRQRRRVGERRLRDPSAPTRRVERDPIGPPSGDLHVILGSSFLQGSVSELRLSYRDYGTKPRPDVGFRVARYAE